VAIVEFVELILRWLESLFRHWLIQKLLLWLSEGHSVLSNSPVYRAPTQHVINKAIIIAAPIGWCILLLYNVLLTCAMVAIASMLQRIPEAGTGTLRDAVAPIKSTVRRILVFAITLFGLNVIGQTITSFLALLVQPINLNNFQSRLEQILSLSLKSQIALEQSNFISNIFANLWPIPITLCVVYVIAVLQIRLLQPPGTYPTAQQIGNARIVWFLAAITSTVATCASILLEASLLIVLQQSHSIIYLFDVVIHLIRLAIYAPLFIAIYLIATPESPLLISSTLAGPCPEEDTPPAEEAI
jgi:hypothetical protein